MELQEAQKFVLESIREITNTFQKVPGSAMLIRYIQSSYQDDPVRSAIELILVIFFVRYLLAPSYSTHTGNFVTLSEEEIDDLVDEWTPEPLVPNQTPFEEAENERLPVIVGPTGPKSKLSNGRTVTNLASYNFYNFVSNDQVKEKAIQTLRTYGVGPCGPPQFYGTQDVHMKTEADIASCLGTEGCIVYAQAFSTISSVIPAFCKRGDIIVADRAVNYAIRKGLQICRSTIRYYEHNDMEDLERVLQKVVKEQAKKPLTRRFIVTEGLSETVGDCVDLPKLIELKLRYKFRLMLDETWSFGVLGRTGRGLTEAQNVDASQVDMLIGSLAGPLCAGGGFCAGSSDVVEHQRISAASYTFSAALPAMLATTASETLNMLQTNSEILVQCRENIKAMRAQLDPRSDWVHCTSSPENPVMLLVLKPDIVNSRRLSIEEQERVLQECVDEALANGILITRLKSMPVAPSTSGKDEGWKLKPALKVCITTGLSKKEIEKAGITIRHAITKVLTRKTNNTTSKYLANMKVIIFVATLAALFHFTAAQPFQARHTHRNKHEKKDVIVTVIETVYAQATEVPEVIVFVDQFGKPFSTVTEGIFEHPHSTLDVSPPSTPLPDGIGAPTIPVGAQSTAIPTGAPDSAVEATQPQHVASTSSPAAYTVALPLSDPAQVSSSLNNVDPTTPTTSMAPPVQTSTGSLPSTPEDSAFGFAYSPYLTDGNCKTQEQVNIDLEVIEGGYSVVRTYGTDCNQVATVLSAAKRYGLKLFAGIYDLNTLDEEVATIVSAANGDWSHFDTISVGNELVDTGAATASAVVAAISTTRQLLKKAGYTGKVVTVDTLVAARANPSLCDSSDYCAVNCHPFYDGHTVAADSGKFVTTQISTLRAALANKNQEVVITETGEQSWRHAREEIANSPSLQWPWQGETNGVAVPSPENQASSLSSIKSAFNSSTSTAVILFSTFNDLWKSSTPAQFNAEKYWGFLGDAPSG